jgi:hypothetical protein
LFVRRGHPLFMVWPPGQSVGFIKSAWFVDDREIELGEEERPACLSMRYLLLGAEIGEVVMVGPDFEWLRMSFEVVAEVFKGADDGKEFFIVDIVVLFGWQHGFGVKGNRVPAIKGVWLFQDGSKGKVAGVSDDAKWQGWVQEAQDRGSGKGFDEGAESRVLVGMPDEGVSFLESSNRGRAMME